MAQDSSVEQVRYVSESDARAWMLEGVPDLAEVLDELGPTALPASLEITLVRSASSRPSYPTRAISPRRGAVRQQAQEDEL